MRARTAVAVVIWLSVLFCIPGLAAAQSAEPSAKASAEPATPRAPTAATPQTPQAAPAAATTPANAGNPSANPAATPPANKIDLFPSSVFGPDAPALGMRGGGAGGPTAGAIGGEQRPGFSLGDDTDWRVQAAQVGAMVAGFAVLAALCGGARCLVPDKLSLPGPFAPRPQVVPQLRPPLRGAPRAD